MYTGPCPDREEPAKRETVGREREALSWRGPARGGNQAVETKQPLHWQEEPVRDRKRFRQKQVSIMEHEKEEER